MTDKDVLKKIDLHTHCIDVKGPERLRGDTWPVPDEVRVIYSQNNIEYGIEMSRAAPESSHDPIDNRVAGKLYADNKDIFLGWFCNIDPRMGTNNPRDNLSYYIEYYKALGAVGVGEVQAEMYANDPRVINLMTHCAKCGVPATFHIEYAPSSRGIIDEKELPHLEALLKAVPNAEIIGHAPGFWDNLKNGTITRLMRSYTGLFCDTSAGSGYKALSYDLSLTAEFFEEFSDRIYFATDIRQSSDINASFLKTGRIIDTLYLEGKISEKTYYNICRGNAERLLKRVKKQ